MGILLIGITLAVFWSFPVSAQSDAARMQAYNECTSAFQDQMNRDGVAFMLNGITGNWVPAGIAWGYMIISKAPDCDKVLTQAQKEVIAAKAMKESLREMRDKQPR